MQSQPCSVHDACGFASRYTTQGVCPPTILAKPVRVLARGGKYDVSSTDVLPGHPSPSCGTYVTGCCHQWSQLSVGEDLLALIIYRWSTHTVGACHPPLPYQMHNVSPRSRHLERCHTTEERAL